MHTDTRTTRQFPTYTSPETIGHSVAGRFIDEVVFEVFFPAMSRYFDVGVHWTLAFEFLTKHPTARVAAVRWASEFGSKAEGFSYAYLYVFSGKRHIVVGASHAPGLVEV
jgi:hypothetical protein